ncbi:hypothetical protein GX411_04650 [Candidatus Fermentibacteria bacterium]|nr:hypothetical protein [Candidatus Fermentibacteria bacterium]
MCGAADVTEVQFYATHEQFSEGEFYNAEILLCHSDLEELTTSFDANYTGNEFVLVFWADTLSIHWAAPGWNGLPFDTAFQYDGSRSLILEFRYLGEDGRTVNAGAFYPPTPFRTLDAGLPTSGTGDLLSFMNSLRIFYTPASGSGGGAPGTGPALCPARNPCAAPVLVATMSAESPAEIRLYRLDGRTSWIWSGILPAGDTVLEVREGPLPPGVYLARLVAGQGQAEARILVL